MILREWKDLPEWMRCPEVKYYYDILNQKKLSLRAKRLFDIIVALLLLIILGAPMLIIAVIIKLDSKGPIFYCQERVTAYGKKFRIHKFRTMVHNADQNGTMITVMGDSRITRVGNKIRKMRIDEIPQLLDVLVGNMSFVGTRPEVPKYVKNYTQEMKATLLLPAGITSEASIQYKNEAELLDGADDVERIYIEKVLPAKMEYNLESIVKFSFWRDIKTMVNTVYSVLGRDCLKDKKIKNYKAYKRDVGDKKALVALITNNDDDVYCFRKELIESLLGDGYEILISCPNGPKFELMDKILYRYDNSIIDRRGMNIIADGKLFFHYRALFKKERPDIVLTYTAKPNVYAGIAAKTLNIPYITNVTGIGSVANMNGIKKLVIMSLFTIAYRGAACVMFQNKNNMNLALNHRMVKRECKLIPGSGVDLFRYPLQPYPDGGNGRMGEKVVFNYIGRVLHDKGIDDYIEAAKRIKKNYPQTEFNIIGFIEPTEKHYKKKIEKLQKQGIINYRGNQRDVKPWIARAHAIIHPSTYGEGMSNVLLENASSGRFIITTDNPGCQETVVNKESGFIYKGGNIEELIKAIENFLKLDNETREKMGMRGRKHVEHGFSREIVINAYKEQIEKIL